MVFAFSTYALIVDAIATNVSISGRCIIRASADARREYRPHRPRVYARYRCGRSFNSPARAHVAGTPSFYGHRHARLLQTSTTDDGQETSALWEIAVFLFVVAAGALRLLRQALSFAPIAFRGVVSYGIYLCHELGMVYVERWGYVPWVGAAAGVLIGIAFWAVAERPFTVSPLRPTLVSGFTEVLAVAFRLSAFLIECNPAQSPPLLLSTKCGSIQPH